MKKTKDLTEILRNFKPKKNSFNSYLETDDALFHYTKLSILSQILTKNRFNLSTFYQTNDPKEYKDQLFGIDWHFVNDHIDVSKGNAQASINSILRHKMRVMFLCTNRNQNTDQSVKSIGWKKARMWSEHGDRHYGSCIVFSKNKLENYLKKKFKNEYYEFGFVKYTEYDNKYNKALQIDSVKLDQMDNIESYSLYHVKKYIEYFCFQKNVDYQDESEYRVIIYDKNNNNMFLNISEFRSN